MLCVTFSVLICWMSFFWELLCWVCRILFSAMLDVNVQCVVKLRLRFSFLLCWMPLCWMSFCWMSFCRIPFWCICYAECHYVECHYAKCHYAECHYAECHNAKCHYTECHYAKCHHTKYHYAECRYAKCHYAECSGTRRKALELKNQRLWRDPCSTPFKKTIIPTEPRGQLYKTFFAHNIRIFILSYIAC